MTKKVIANFKSESGDGYYINPDVYDAEVKAYRAAVNSGEEGAMLKFEEGDTGWIYTED